MGLIKGKQLANTLRSESDPFDIIYSDKTVGDVNGAIRFTALNNTGSTIGAYKVVYINGVSGNTPTIALADADTASMPAFGLTAASVNTGNEVDVITFGNIKGVDTSLLSVGDVLYVSTTAGEYTNTKPTGSSTQLQNIGMVVKSDQNGIIKVGGAGRSAATPNLDEGTFFIGNASNQSSISNYTLPVNDGASGQVLTANGDGTVTFQTPSATSVGLNDIGAGTAESTLTTTVGNIIIDAQASNSNIIFKGTTNSVDKTFLTLDGSNSGTAIFNHDVKLQSDSSKLYFGADDDVYFSHTPDVGLTLNLTDNTLTGKPRLILHNDSDGFSTNALLRFSSGTASPAANDTVAKIDVTVGSQIYGLIEHQIVSATSNSEAGRVIIAVANAGSESNTAASRGLVVEGSSSGAITTTVTNHNGTNSGLKLASTLVTATGDELNFLDTSLKSPSANDVLTYNGTTLAWSAPSGGSVSDINDLGDVSVANLSAGQALVYNGTNWVNASNASGYPMYTTPSNQNAQVNSSYWFTGLSATDWTVTLPLTTNSSSGDVVIIARKNGGNVTIQQNASDTGTKIRYFAETDASSKTISITEQQIYIRYVSGYWYIVDGALADVSRTGDLNDLANVNYTAGAAIDNYVLTYDHNTSSWGAEAAASGGGTSYTYSAVSAASVTGQAWYHYSVDTSTNAVTINLPALNTPTTDGDEIRVKVMDATNTVTIDANSTETIDGNTTLVLNTQYESVTLVAGSTGWEII